MVDHQEKTVKLALWRGRVPITFTLAVEDRAISSSFQKISLAHRSTLYSNSNREEKDEEEDDDDMCCRVLASRYSYLYAVAASAVDFFQFVVIDFETDLWFESSSGVPLSSHLPIGVLYDLHNPNRLTNAYSCSTRERELREAAVRAGAKAEIDALGSRVWKITVHFRNRPSSLLPLKGATWASPAPAPAQAQTQTQTQTQGDSTAEPKLSTGQEYCFLAEKVTAVRREVLPLHYTCFSPVTECLQLLSLA